MAVNAQQLQADDDAYAESVKQNPPGAAQAPQTHADLVDQIQNETGAAKKVSLFQQFGNVAGRVTTNVLDSVVSAADSMYDSEPVKKARDVVAGGLTAAANTGDASMSAAENGPGKPFVQMAGGPGVVNSIWNHAKSALMDFRDAVAVQDPSLTDNLVQGVGQLALPFAGYSRALGGLHGLASTLEAGMVTDATALAPHDSRMADLFSLGKQTEGKFGDVLRTLAPDGSALNAYVNFLGDRGDESEAEGRFKNVLDGFGSNLIATPLLHTVGMVLKQGTAGLRYAMENGVGSAGDLMPANQAGYIDPFAKTNMSLPPEQRAAARAAVAAQRAEEEGMTPEIEPMPVFPNALEREREAARRDKASDSELPPPAVDTMTSDQIQSHIDMLRAEAERRRGADPDTKVEGSRPAETAAAINNTSAENGPLEKDASISSARTFMQSQMDAGHVGSVHGMATTLAKHMDVGTEDGAFYKDLLTRIAGKNLSTKIVPPGSAEFRIPGADEAAKSSTKGIYNKGTDAMSLYQGAMSSNASMVHTFAHEAVHAATMKEIDAPAVKSALQDIIDRGSFGNAASHYGLTNPRELVAEAESNPKFQEILKNAPAGDGMTAWDKYKKVIGGIFGLSGAAVMSPQFDKVLTKEKEGA